MFTAWRKKLMAALRGPAPGPKRGATDPTLALGTTTPFAKKPPAQTPPSPVSEAPVASTAPARPPVLKLKFGGVRHLVSAADGEIMIGRGPDTQINVSSPHVSRHHATLLWDPNGYPRLVNLSQAGTSLKPSGGAPRVVDGSCKLEGEGSIGLFADYAVAEANGMIVKYEAKWPKDSG